MGFEIVYHFCEEITKGEYDKENIKMKTVKIGSPLDDIPMGVLAGKIMSQFARRNILIMDVEIYEYTKKKIAFRETNDGIVIRGKKYNFDDGTAEFEEVGDEPCCGGGKTPAPAPTETVLEALLKNPAILNLLQQTGQQKPVKNQNPDGLPTIDPNAPSPYKVLRYEIYNPVDKIFVDDAKNRKLAFTLGKRYPIMKERKASSEMVGFLYTVTDDNGKLQSLSDKFFSPETVLANAREEEFKPTVEGKKGDGLDWSGFTNEYDNMGNVNGSIR